MSCVPCTSSPLLCPLSFPLHSRLYPHPIIPPLQTSFVNLYISVFSTSLLLFLLYILPQSSISSRPLEDSLQSSLSSTSFPQSSLSSTSFPQSSLSSPNSPSPLHPSPNPPSQSSLSSTSFPQSSSQNLPLLYVLPQSWGKDIEEREDW